MRPPDIDTGGRLRGAGTDEASLRILLVASAFPALTTGRLRQVHFVRGLGARHRVSVVSLADPGVAAAPPSLEGAANVVAVAAPPQRGSGARARRWLARMRNRPTDELLVLAEAACNMAAAERFDVMLVAGREIGPIFGHLPRLPLVLDLCDSRAVRLRGQARVAPRRARPGLAVRYATERRYERSLVERSDHVLVASERDREALDRRIPTPVTIVPNGVDTDSWCRRTAQLGDAVVFSGAMDYPANADAAVHLASHVMPLVWQKRPTARLIIVGRDPVPTVNALADDPRVIVTGTVDDIRPFLEQAAVFAAPLRFASGIQNKLLEAMAMAIPVVTSPVAAAGLRTADGAHAPVRVAAGPEAFAAGILAALEQRDADPSPDGPGREYVEARFGWGTAVTLLEEALADVVRRGSARDEVGQGGDARP